MSLQNPTNSGWFMDFGATNHLSTGTGNLRNVFNKMSFSSILVGDGSPTPVTTIPHRPLHLHNILVTPNIIKNLISVS